MRVAFILSSVATFPQTDAAIGVWLEELIAPYYFLMTQGAQLSIATPKGGNAAVDPASIKAIEGTVLHQRFTADPVLEQKLARSERIVDLRVQDLDAIIYPGGYSPMFDLRQDPHSIALIQSVFKSGKIVAAVCHGVCALLNVQVDSRALVQGKRVTGFSDGEERAIGMENTVPYSVEQELIALGASYLRADDWQANVITDGLLHTGQNPASAELLAHRIAQALA